MWIIHHGPHTFAMFLESALQTTLLWKVCVQHATLWRRGRRKSTWFAPALNHCGDQFASIHSILVMPQTILHVHVCLLMAGYLEIKQLNRLLPLPTKLMYQTMSSDVHSILRKLR